MPKVFSDRLRDHIKACGVPVPELARRVGVPKGNLYSFLTGKRGLSMEVIDRLFLLLDLRIEGGRRKQITVIVPEDVLPEDVERWVADHHAEMARRDEKDEKSTN